MEVQLQRFCNVARRRAYGCMSDSANRSWPASGLQDAVLFLQGMQSRNQKRAGPLGQGYFSIEPTGLSIQQRGQNRCTIRQGLRCSYRTRVHLRPSWLGFRPDQLRAPLVLPCISPNSGCSVLIRRSRRPIHQASIVKDHPTTHNMYESLK